MIDVVFQALAAFVVGASVGSAVANTAWCWPDRLSGMVARRSACESCGEPLGWLDLIPVASWFIRGGKCAHCEAGIPGYYWQVELAAGLIASISLILLGLFPGAIAAAAGWALLLMARIDLDQMILPNVLTLPFLALGLLASFWPLWPGPGITDASIGALAGYCLLAGISWAYLKIRGRDGLGMGDAKLLAASGAWVGWEGMPNILMLAASATLIIALLRGHRLSSSTPIPFGPALAAASFAQILLSWQR